LIVLDASLMIEWLVGRAGPPVAQEAYEALPELLVWVPSHWPLEVSNALRSDIRSGKLTVHDFHAIMDRFDLFDIKVERPIELDEIGPLAEFAVTHRLTAYDAGYVQLALRRKAILATLDDAMRAAAQRLDIPLLPA
jgi:predicted nucleic acid-binding protein